MSVQQLDISPDIAVALLGQTANRNEATVYYRKANVGLEAGWIAMTGNNTSRLLMRMAQGGQPLLKYGEISGRKRQEDPPNVVDLYGPWAQILTHPDGPAEFPAEQVIALRWYDPQFCPVPNVKWPQLRGEIKEYVCPECSDARFHKPIGLARHLRVSHSYPAESLIKYGESVGIDFTPEFAQKGVVIHSFDDRDDADEASIAAPVEEPSFQVSVEQPQIRRGRNASA